MRFRGWELGEGPINRRTNVQTHKLKPPLKTKKNYATSFRDSSFAKTKTLRLPF